MKQSKILSVLLAVLTACLVLSSSVAVPILCRPFYYAHIGPFGAGPGYRPDRGGDPPGL